MVVGVLGNVELKEQAMPTKPKSPCVVSNCPNLALKHGMCVEHVREYEQRRRETPTVYDGRWVKIRQLWLIDHPLCVECSKEGRAEPGNIVDHIKPHRGNIELFYDLSNLQTLCKRHHDIKTAQGR